MNEKIRELFSSLLRNNTEATSQTFASIMKDKLNDALEIRKVGLTSKIFNKVEVQESVELEEAVEKIACLKCDAVSTAMAWKKNKGFCPVCKTSSQGVAESNELEEATDADLKKVIDTAKKMGGKISGNTANFGKDSEITFSIEKGKIKFDGGKSGGIEYFNNVNDAIASLTIGLED